MKLFQSQRSTNASRLRKATRNDAKQEDVPHRGPVLWACTWYEPPRDYLT